MSEMGKTLQTSDDVEALRARVAELEDTLESIRSNQVDAIVIADGNRQRIVTLHGADQAYRTFVEEMGQGAVTIDKDGTILYCNEAFAELLDTTYDRLIAHSIFELTPEEHAGELRALIWTGQTEHTQQRFCLRDLSGRERSVLISAGCVRSDEEAYVPLDVSERLATLDEIVDEANAKVVIFVPYTGALHRVLDHMGKRFTVAKIDGSTSRTQRKQIIAAFESTPNPQIIVAHPKTAAHGLNLVAADTMIWFSPIHSLDIYGQACERMARPGQKLTTRIVHIGATKIEWGVYAALREKERFQARLFDLFKEEMKV